MRYQLTVLLVIISTFAQVQLCTAESDGTENSDSELNTEMYENKRYVSKCCPSGSALTKTDCRNTSVPFNLTTWKGSKEYNANDGFILNTLSNCNYKITHTYQNYHDDEYHLTKNGSLSLDTPNGSLILDIYHYCIDRYIIDNETTMMAAWLCLPPVPDHTNYTLNANCMLISCFFILLTVGVYVCTAKWSKLPGIILIAYLLSFFVAFLCLTILMFLNDQPTRTTCTICTFIIYFSMISAFSWINVMCYDICFRGTSTTQSSLSTSSLPEQMKRFCCYCAYAFGVPTALSAILAICEYTDLPVPIKPEFHKQRCFFDGKVRHYYLDLPMLVLCIINIIFFIMTVMKIVRHNRRFKKQCSQDSDTHNKHKQQIYLYVKFFTLMGITWILEVAGSFLPAGYALWQVIDVYNLLVGFIIFVMFVCKKEVWKDIVKKYNSVRGVKIASTISTTTISLQTQSSQSKDRREKDTMNIKEVEMPMLNGDPNLKCADNYM